jgi:hypothetical protein
MKAWKQAEKEVAKWLGGFRRVRVGYGERIGDIGHPYHTVEVKWGKQIPKVCRVKHPTLLITSKASWLLTPSSWTYAYIMRPVRVKRKRCKFLEDAFEQALRYDPDKVPLVGLKPKGYRGFVMVQRVLNGKSEPIRKVRKNQRNLEYTLHVRGKHRYC